MEIYVGEMPGICFKITVGGEINKDMDKIRLVMS